MSLISRAKNIILRPASEWQVIAAETATPGSLLTSYVIPMALIPAVCCFIGYGFIGDETVLFRIRGIKWGVAMALNSFIVSLAVYWAGTYIVDSLGANFDSPKNPGRSAQLVAYSCTAAWLAGIFCLVPILQRLTILGFYGGYLFYLGLPVLKHTPADQRIPYVIVSIIVVIVIRFLTGLLMDNITYLLTGNPFLP